MKRDQMRIKSYFAKSVDQAMAQAREELGDEAMLLNTRKAPADHPSGMNYEVIFGVVNEGVVDEGVVKQRVVNEAVPNQGVARVAPAPLPVAKVESKVERPATQVQAHSLEE